MTTQAMKVHPNPVARQTSVLWMNMFDWFSLGSRVSRTQSNMFHWFLHFCRSRFGSCLAAMLRWGHSFSLILLKHGESDQNKFIISQLISKIFLLDFLSGKTRTACFLFTRHCIGLLSGYEYLIYLVIQAMISLIFLKFTPLFVFINLNLLTKISAI